jgi:hypothetical protein
MRGLSEIRSTNEDPSASFRSREPQHGHVESGDKNISFESNMAEKRRREETDEIENLLRDLGHATGHRTLAARTKEQNARKALQQLDELFFTALLLDLFAAKTTRVEPEHQERVESAIDAEPPFLAFWRKLNEGLTAAGKSEAAYGDAKRAFLGGPTPVGAMTFVGKEWNGIRAIPSAPVNSLGGVRPAYHGEYCRVTDHGTIWDKVTNKHDLPIAYALPEAALIAAKDRRTEIVATAREATDNS